MTFVTALFFIYVGASLDWKEVFKTIQKQLNKMGIDL